MKAQATSKPCSKEAGGSWLPSVALPPLIKKSKMGRKKVCPETLRQSGTQRKETFGKRTRGLFKKAHELSAMCGAAVYLAVAGEDNRLFQMHRMRNPHLDQLLRAAATTGSPACTYNLINKSAQFFDLQPPPAAANHHHVHHRHLESNDSIVSTSMSGLEHEKPTAALAVDFPGALAEGDTKGPCIKEEHIEDDVAPAADATVPHLPATTNTPTTSTSTAAFTLEPGVKIWFYNHITEKMEYSGVDQAVVPIDPSLPCFPLSPCPCADCLSGRSRFVGRINTSSTATGTSTVAAASGFDNIAHVCKGAVGEDYITGVQEAYNLAFPSKGDFYYYDICEERLNSMSEPISSADSSPGDNAGDIDHEYRFNVEPKIEALEDLDFFFNMNPSAGIDPSFFDTTTWFDIGDQQPFKP